MISILYQNKFGGTDLLLKRMEQWLKKNNYNIVSETYACENQISIDLMIVPTSEINKLWKLKRQGLKFQRILIWSMGHGALKAAFYNKKFSKSFYGFPKKLIDFFVTQFAISLMKTNSIVFTDMVGLHHDLDGIDLSGHDIESLICPIAIKKYDSVSNPSERGHNNVTLGWVGRVSQDFKLLPLIKLINDLEVFTAVRGDVSNLIIVGDGDGSASLADFLKKNRNLKIEWIKEVEHDLLVEFIDKNIDILFAMGTSALDGANSFTPTVIVQPFSDVKEMPDNGYRWIHDSIGFSLGEFPNTAMKSVSQVDVGMESIFQDVDSLGIERLSQMSKNYSALFYEDNVFLKMFKGRKIEKCGLSTLFYLFTVSLFYDIKMLLKKLRRCN